MARKKEGKGTLKKTYSLLLLSGNAFSDGGNVKRGGGDSTRD